MHNKYLNTKFISINTDKCTACWKCIERCSAKVIVKLNLLIHKHARLSNPDNCIGCLRCIKACEHAALESLRPVKT